MKMKISDIIRKSNDENLAQIIGAVIAMQIEKVSLEEAMKSEYPETLKTLQSEMEVEYKQTNADRIRSMTDEELAEFLISIEEDALNGEVWEYEHVCINWLQREPED